VTDERRLQNLGFELLRVQDEHDPHDGRLVLRDINEGRMLPLAVDFLEPRLLHRLKHGLSKRQPMARALGFGSAKKAGRPYVIDATAGLGVDSFFMAALGCRVLAVERSETVAALLEDGLRRLRAAVARGGVEPYEALNGIVERLSLVKGDAREVLASLDEAECPDIVYLDPMYPEEDRSESALPKKGMQMFRRLIGDDADVESVFEIARKKARDRVVVKRPLRAPPIAGVRPTHSFEGKTARYDMYHSQTGSPSWG